MKILVDMNLSPGWCEVLEKHGWSAVHWSSVGDPRARHQDVMQWARANGCAVFTHNLGFGTLLAATQAGTPSVIQVRGQDVLPAQLESVAIRALRQFESLLEQGALIVAEPARARARILPLKG